MFDKSLMFKVISGFAMTIAVALAAQANEDASSSPQPGPMKKMEYSIVNVIVSATFMDIIERNDSSDGKLPANFCEEVAEASHNAVVLGSELQTELEKNEALLATHEKLLSELREKLFSYDPLVQIFGGLSEYCRLSGEFKQAKATGDETSMAATGQGRSEALSSVREYISVAKSLLPRVAEVANASSR